MPGARLNPNGRPKDLQAMRELIREHGPALMKRTIAIALGDRMETITTLDGKTHLSGAKLADQLRAQELCYSYWLGRPTQAVTLELGEDGTEFVRALVSRMRQDPATASAMLTIAESSAKGE